MFGKIKETIASFKMEYINNCPTCALNLSNYVRALHDIKKVEYKLSMAKWRIERNNTRIKQLEDDRKEVFDLASSIALANIDDRLVDPINRIAKLSKPIGDK